MCQCGINTHLNTTKKREAFHVIHYYTIEKELNWILNVEKKRMDWKRVRVLPIALNASF